MADPINFQDKLKARQTEQDAVELHMEGVDDRLQIVAAAIKEMIEPQPRGHSKSPAVLRKRVESLGRKYIGRTFRRWSLDRRLPGFDNKGSFRINQATSAFTL